MNNNDFLRMRTSLEIIECHRTTHFGSIMEIKHTEPGLPKGLKLRGTRSSLEWIVDSRIIFSPAVLLHTRFDCETEVLMKIKMSPLSAITKFKQKIVDKERNCIYQYRLTPVNHTSHPDKQDELCIVD